MATIHIVGGGVAGLTLAATLQRPEWDVVVYEQGRGADEREVGTAFGLWPAAMAALATIGVAESVRGEGVHATTATIRSSTDRVLATVPKQDVVMISRTSLHKILRDAVPASVGFRAERVGDVRVLGPGLVVGADGVRSVVRRDYWGVGSAARSRRTTVIRGVLDGELSGGEVTEYWGRGQLFGITPVAKGATNWFAAFPERRFTGPADALHHLGRVVEDFPVHVRQVVAAAEPDRTLVNGTTVSRTLTSMVRGPAVLIGDAAHAMPPNLGRGACESIRDAVALGTLLNEDSPAEAIRRYSVRRLIAPQLIKVASSAVMRIALASGSSARIRDGLVTTLAR